MVKARIKAGTQMGHSVDNPVFNYLLVIYKHFEYTLHILFYFFYLAYFNTKIVRSFYKF